MHRKKEFIMFNIEPDFCGSVQGNCVKRQVTREVVEEVMSMFLEPDVDENTNLKEIGADSLDMDELFLNLEGRFGCKISDYTLHYQRPPVTVLEVVEVVLDTLKT